MQPLSFILLHCAAMFLLAVLSYGPGRRLIWSLPCSSLGEELSVAITLGLGVIALGVFVVGLAGLLKPLPVLGLLVLLQALSARVWQDVLSRLSGRLRLRPRLQTLACLLIGAALLAPLLALPFYPPIEWDAIMYHLPYAKIFVQQGQVVVTPFLRFPVFPQLNEMLFALMLMFYDDIAAQFVQLLMTFVLAAALHSWGCRLFSPRTGLWAAALWLGNPLVLWLGGSAYVDVGLALFVTMAAYAFWNWRESLDRRWLILAAVFCGFAASSKYSGLFIVAILGLIGIHDSVRSRDSSRVLIFTAAVAAVAGPWYLRNLFYTGDPFFPFAGFLFGYSFWSPGDLFSHLQSMRAQDTDKTLLSFLCLPWSLAFHQDMFHREESVSKIYFLAFPLVAVFGLKTVRARIILLVCAAYTALWFFSIQQLHYLVPVLPLFSLLTALALDGFLRWMAFLSRWREHFLVAALGCAVLGLPGWRYAVGRCRERGAIPVSAEHRDAFLGRHLPTYGAYSLLNQLRGQNYRLYALYDENMAYFADGVFMGDWVGPGRFDPIEAAARVGGQALYEALSGFEADYFLFAQSRKRVELPDDDAFHKHFKPIHAHPYGMLFELRP